MSCSYFLINQKKLFQTIQRIQYNQFERQCKYFHTFYCNNCLFRNYNRVFRHLRSSNTAQKFRQNVHKRFYSNQTKTKTFKTFKKSEVLKLLSLAKPERWNILGAVCLLVISSGVTMAVPFSLGKVLDIIYSADTGSPQESSVKLNRLCAILIGVFVVGALANFGRVYMLSCAGYRVTQKLRKDVFESILRQEQQFFDARSTGELVNRLSADAQLVGQALSGNLSDGLRSTFSVLAGSGMMVYTSPELAAVGLSVVPPIALLAVLYGRFVRNITRSVQDSLAAASTLAEEKISNIRTVKVFAREPFEQRNYATKMDRVLHLGYTESLARAAFYGAAGLAGNSIVIGVLYYGGSMVAHDHAITLGSLSAFLMYAAYIGVSVGGLTRFYTEMNRSMGAASRLWELLDRQPKIPYKGGVIPQTHVLGRLTFENVKFGYIPNQPVLDDVKLDIKPGQTVAVVGSSGSGKSTLASLLLRLYEPTAGNVLVDGIDVKSLDPSWLRTHIGTVSQEPVLFSGTIRENILYGADDPLSVSEEQLQEAISEANLKEFVSQLPQGLETEIGERGLTLSGGQRQRIAIARALIKRPNILLLDEATSALDSKSEFLVREALERVTKNRTVLTIAHRLSTIRNADTIAVLEAGKIVETGKYEELLRKPDGRFKELVMHQTFKDVT